MTKAPRRRVLATLVTATAAVAALLVAVSPAHAEESSSSGASPAPMAPTSGGGPFNISSAPFGDSGQMAFVMLGGGDFPFTYSKSGGDSGWRFHFQPALDYFLQSNVSIGGRLIVETGGGSSTVGLGARAGYHLPISGLVSLWALGGLTFAHTSVSNGPSRSVTTLDINVPFLFHLVPHFLIGIGPFFGLPLTNSQAMANKDPSYGLTALVGGYF